MQEGGQRNVRFLAAWQEVDIDSPNCQFHGKEISSGYHRQASVGLDEFASNLEG
jgi:hypothetical protein